MSLSVMYPPHLGCDLLLSYVTVINVGDAMYGNLPTQGPRIALLVVHSAYHRRPKKRLGKDVEAVPLVRARERI